jgi:hypothetical protein
MAVRIIVMGVPQAASKSRSATSRSHDACNLIHRFISAGACRPIVLIAPAITGYLLDGPGGEHASLCGPRTDPHSDAKLDELGNDVDGDDSPC